VDELAFRVKFFALADRIENAEIRLSIAAGAGRPLPATIVGR
jgi:hypothetical protein